MARISQEDISAILQAADIAQVISNYIPIEKKGKSYRAVCPFHDDHDPSMHISPERQIFKCFVCGTGGNVFTFVQKYENISFPEAVVKVAQLIGYDLHVSLNSFEKKSHPYQSHFDCLQVYLDFLRYELHGQEGHSAKSYLESRKIGESLIDHFQIGYAPSNDRSMHFLQAKRYEPALLKEVGIVNDHDRAIFTNRIMIPIHDELGHPLGFTARTLSKIGDEPKYINTSSTPIYEKGNVVFNYHRAKQAVKQSHRVFLCEGAMDVIGLAKADIFEAVACLGTACTSRQLELLKRLGCPLIVFYDGDQAGQNATYKFSMMALESGLDFSIVKNDSKLDPDEIMDAYGKEGLLQTITSTIPFVEFLFTYLMNKYDLNNYEDKKEYAKQIAYVIDRSCDSYEKPGFYQRLKSLTGFDFSQNLIQVARKEAPVERVVMSSLSLDSGRYAAEKAVLSMMLLSKEATNRFKEQVGFFQDTSCEQLALYLYDEYRYQDVIDLSVLISKIKEDRVRNLLVGLMDDFKTLPEYCEDYFEDGLAKIKYCTLQEQIDFINEQISKSSLTQEKIDLANKKRELILLRNEIRNGKD